MATWAHVLRNTDYTRHVRVSPLPPRIPFGPLYLAGLNCGIFEEFLCARPICSHRRQGLAKEDLQLMADVDIRGLLYG